MKTINLKKQTTLAMLAALGYVLNTFVSFPRMAPFQHMINVIAAVVLGPTLSFICALIIGCLRMLLNGNTILAVIGAVIGAYLSGVFYKRTQKLSMAVLGEVIGTGVISAIVSYPFMVHFYGLPPTSIFTYIPFFTPSSFMGAIIGFFLLKALERTGNLKKIKQSLEE